MTTSEPTRGKGDRGGDGSGRAGAGVVVLLALRFLLEVALLVALLVGAVSSVGVTSPVAGWLLGAVLVVLTAVVWGVFLSPRRRVHLPLAVRVVVELLLFLGAALLLWAGGHEVAAGVLIVAEVVVLAALRGPDHHAGALG